MTGEASFFGEPTDGELIRAACADLPPVVPPAALEMFCTALERLCARIRADENNACAEIAASFGAARIGEEIRQRCDGRRVGDWTF